MKLLGIIQVTILFDLPSFRSPINYKTENVWLPSSIIVAPQYACNLNLVVNFAIQIWLNWISTMTYQHQSTINIVSYRNKFSLAIYMGW